MNDDARFERLFADGLTGLAPSRAPDGLGSTIKTTTSRMRPRPRWLALIKEPPMRTLIPRRGRLADRAGGGRHGRDPRSCRAARCRGGRGDHAVVRGHAGRQRRLADVQA